ncbi:hypothetical protein N7508_010404 [Penicillium antarcticum]|uniref:uncharacterized protein n=1 Tax=Penicillium antarcticum TaxID=416450 RepID=UPI00239A6BC8|nr:uncharacterized protein N7508_010404 [Penicillium antarcticum]KAJ5295583.1 hypothetical protein N7508_010404 [Penicillium antarcticum]
MLNIFFHQICLSSFSTILYHHLPSPYLLTASLPASCPASYLMSSHALDRDSNNDPTDEPTEPEPIDPHPYGEQIQIFINPHGDRLTAEEEIFIHFVRPLAYRLILESVFTYTQEMQQIVQASELTHITA